MKTYDQAINFIELKSSLYWKDYQQKYNCGDIPKINCEIKKSKTAGFAFYNQSKGVEFNLTYFCTHENDHELSEIIAHELAHIVQFRCFPEAKQAHGPEFRFILQSIGFSGNTYHSMDVSKAKNSIKAIERSIISEDDF